MRRWLVVIAVVAACKSGKDAGKSTEAVHNAAEAVPAPKVSVASVLAKEDAKPPLLVIVESGGTARFAAAKTWADLDANKVQIAKTGAKLEVLDKYSREDYALKRDPVASVEDWDKHGDSPRDLTAIGGTPRHTVDQDDPPPPPPEDESGGTGTAMALDEGKMGQKDARQQAIEQARVAGVLGSDVLAGSPVGTGWNGRQPNEDGTPSRVAAVEGTVMKDGKLDPLRAMLLVPPTAKAAVLIDAVRDTGDAIAVSFNGKIRPLHLQFSMRDTANIREAAYWIEARVSAKAIAVEAVPDKPVEVAAIDQLGPALAKVREGRRGEAGSVDVLVDADVDVQRLIDVLVALDVAGVPVIGMGPPPTGEELARRGHRIAVVMLGQPNAQGDLDKSEIRKVVKNAKQQFTNCYEKQLATAPNLGGTVSVQFFIKPDGTVPNAAANGVDPEVSTCVAKVFEGLVFPKPNGRAGVQVNYPMTFHH